MTTNDMRNLAPSEAMGLFLDDKRASGLSDRSIQTYSSELKAFTAWCQENGVTAVHELDGLAVKQYKKAQADEYAPSTVGNRVRTAVELLQWCVTVNAADGDIVREIEIDRPQDVRSGEVTADEAEAILQRLDRYQYASREHVTFLLLWHVGCRLGTVRGLDRDDIQVSGPALRIRHRPETDTPLKNGERAERSVALSDEVHAVVADYIDTNRVSVTDEYGREPLLTTTQGRFGLSTLRASLYALTRPCWYGDECPEGRCPDDCDAARTKRDARSCPANNSPHDVRRGRLTHYRREGVDSYAISDRCDVSKKILEEHYNEMDEDEKREQRRDEFDDID